MNYSYTASGYVEIIGCCGYRWINFLYYEYAVGSTVYSKPKALKGKYEKVVIKSVRFPEIYANTGKFPMAKYANLHPLYTDTLNALWNEEDLVSFSAATLLIENYHVQRGLIGEQALRLC